MKTKIYQVKKGYDTIASFDDLDHATKFFSDLTRGSGRSLMKVEGKGRNPKVAYYWGHEVEYSLKIVEASVYPSKKEAEFAVFEGGEGDDESI